MREKKSIAEVKARKAAYAKQYWRRTRNDPAFAEYVKKNRLASRERYHSGNACDGELNLYETEALYDPEKHARRKRRCRDRYYVQKEIKALMGIDVSAFE